MAHRSWYQRDLESNSRFPLDWLCDLGEMTSPFSFPSYKMGPMTVQDHDETSGMPHLTLVEQLTNMSC